MIRYIVFGLLLIIGILCGTSYYFQEKANKLQEQNNELQEANIQMEVSLHLEKQRTKIMDQMYKNVQKQREKLNEEIEILKTTQVVVRERYGNFLKKGDPYYNPNLSIVRGDCAFRMASEKKDEIV